MVVGLPVAVRVAYPSVGAGLPHMLPLSAVELKFTAAFSLCVAHARLSHLCRVPTCGLVIIGRSKRGEGGGGFCTCNVFIIKRIW